MNVMQHKIGKVLKSNDVVTTQWWTLFVQATVYKPFIMLIVIFLFQQLSGPYVIVFYAVDLFVEIGGKFGDYIDEYGAMLLLSILRLIMTIACTWYVAVDLFAEKLRKKNAFFLPINGVYLFAKLVDSTLPFFFFFSCICCLLLLLAVQSI